MSQEENKKEPNKAPLPTKTAIIIRIAVAAYILYLAFGLKDAFHFPIESDNLIPFIAAIVFIFAGSLIIILSLRKLITGNYRGGDMDPDKDETDTDDSSEL